MNKKKSSKKIDAMEKLEKRLEEISGGKEVVLFLDGKIYIKINGFWSIF